jgi:hypothetical protein
MRAAVGAVMAASRDLRSRRSDGLDRSGAIAGLIAGVHRGAMVRPSAAIAIRGRLPRPPSRSHHVPECTFGPGRESGWGVVDKAYLLTFGRNGFVLLSGTTWEDARPQLKRLWEQSEMVREARWEVVENVVHGAWVMSAAAFARARIKAHARQRIEGAILAQRMVAANADVRVTLRAPPVPFTARRREG